MFLVLLFSLFFLESASKIIPDGMVLIQPQHKLIFGRTRANEHTRTDWKKTTVQPFLMDTTPVTNKAFALFVKETKFVSEAEKFQWSFVFEMFVTQEIKKKIKDSVKGAEWWLPVEGAYWGAPSGPGSSYKTKLEHPVVHMSYNDAYTYCEHRGARLATEEEWEFAVRGGMRDQLYPWGNAYERRRMNIWEGKFPKENTAKDGYIGVAPVTAFKPQNEFGLYDMVGNVWEWTSNIFGVDRQTKMPQYTLRGGSYIDSIAGQFNHQADVTTRMGNTADAGSDNIGFRCAKDISAKEIAQLQATKSEL